MEYNSEHERLQSLNRIHSLYPPGKFKYRIQDKTRFSLDFHDMSNVRVRSIPCIDFTEFARWAEQCWPHVIIFLFVHNTESNIERS